MSRYIVKRLFYIVFVIFIVSIMLFYIYNSIPGGDHARLHLYVPEGLQQTDPVEYAIRIAKAKEELGIGKPIYIQYLKWAGKLLEGDFGITLQTKQPVLQYIKSPMWNTIKLNIFVLILVFAITFPLGVQTAVKKYSNFDNSVQVFTVIGMSLPIFFIALIMILVFSVWLKHPNGGPLFPSTGTDSGYVDRLKMNEVQKLFDSLRYMTLPVLTLTVASLAGITRFVRGAMIDILSQDYIRTARAKGLKEKVVIYSHGFRNAMIPVVTIITGWLIGVFSGSTLTETIFAWRGMGRTLFEALMQGPDFSVILAMNMFYTILALVANLILDLLYTVVDPRVKLS